jgi:integrase
MSDIPRPADRRRRAAVPGSEGTTRDVRRPWKIGKARSKSTPYMVRWVVAGQVATRTFPSATLADSFRSGLIAAIGHGEPFDIATGLPVSMLPTESPAPAATWLSFCTEYVAARWDGAAAKTRDSITDSLATAAVAMTDSSAGKPAPGELRRAFLWAVLPANKQLDPPPELADALCWLRRHCLPAKAMADPRVARAVLHRLTLKLDGHPVAGETWRRRRRGLNTAVQYAIELGELEDNPLKQVKTGRVGAADQVDPRVVVTHTQARELLTAVSYVGSWDRGRGRRLVGFYAVMYYGGLRPAEAVALREADCYLPATGWGKLELAKSLPVTTKKWTDHGQRHDPRGLKQRDPDAVRPVPIPPWLVAILREHIKEFGTAPDGRLFRNERGGIIGSTTYSRVWEEARQLAFTPAQVRSPLASRPYDLRHAALTTWLNAGTPAAEVAKRAGNSAEVLLRRYAGCVDKQSESVNRRIEQAMREDISPEMEP